MIDLDDIEARRATCLPSCGADASHWPGTGSGLERLLYTDIPALVKEVRRLRKEERALVADALDIADRAVEAEQQRDAAVAERIARQRGGGARIDGEPATANPHPDGLLWIAWEEGWRAQDAVEEVERLKTQPHDDDCACPPCCEVTALADEVRRLKPQQDDEDDGPRICPTCAGSGENIHSMPGEGTCGTCGGGGEVGPDDEDDDWYDIPDDDDCDPADYDRAADAYESQLWGD